MSEVAALDWSSCHAKGQVMTKKKQDVLQPVDHVARRLGKTLVRTAGYAALATIDTLDGSPRYFSSLDFQAISRISRSILDVRCSSASLAKAILSPIRA
jgi:hypothetical protein